MEYYDGASKIGTLFTAISIDSVHSHHIYLIQNVSINLTLVLYLCLFNGIQH